MGSGHEDSLRSLAVNDQAFLDSVLDLEDREASLLDPKTLALVRLGSLVALDAAAVSYQWGVESALAAGATPAEIVGTLLAVAPFAGIARVVSAAPEIATAIGYDMESALEGPHKQED